MAGKMIVFEGLDGAGTTTQATLLRNYFLSKGKEAFLTKEPTEGIIGGTIKAALRKEWKTSPFTLQVLFSADRSHHLTTEIEPLLKKGKIVICDRYILSSYAYGSLDVSLQILKQLNAYFRKPNMTFFIDTQPSICVERMKKSRPHLELFEEVHKLEQIRRNYLNMKNLFPETYVIDGNRPPEEILSEIIRIAVKS
ncbi:MAG: dTMP kinase [Candidatus Aenigmarchaeota archaeon]|nr:dTMP kinase [Candidatus Aenigmarchaeota archaeon]